MTEQLLDIILDYFRLVSYGIVILTSLRGIAHRKFTNLLFIGDIFIAAALIITVVFFHILKFSPLTTLVDEAILTLGAVVWAVIHFFSMLEGDRKERHEKVRS